MINQRGPNNKNKYRFVQSVEDGFGLVEAMIAGVILLATMTAVGRFTQAAMSSGSNQEIRNRIETQIIDNMQEIQQQDSRLTWKAIEKLQEEQMACSNPAIYAKQKIENNNSGYYVGKPFEIKRDISVSSDAPGIIIITYSFNGPENSVGTEKRIIELNPTFAADCIDIGDSDQ